MISRILKTDRQCNAKEKKTKEHTLIYTALEIGLCFALEIINSDTIRSGLIQISTISGAGTVNFEYLWERGGGGFC
jgi:hypothetical protein